MERLGDILKRIETGAGGADTARSAAEGVEPPAPAAPPCPFCRGAGFLHPLLPSGRPDYTRVEPCPCREQARAQERQARLEGYANLGPLRRLTFESLNPRGRRGDSPAFERAYQAARAFAQQPQGWLVLVGPSGSGKTHLSAAIASFSLAQGRPALFIAVAELLDHLRSTFSPSSPISYDQLFSQVRNTPLLILDDLGGHSTTPWAEEKLLQVIDFRYSSRLPTVITTRQPLSKLEEPLRLRLSDPGLCQVLLLEGEPSAKGGSALDLPLLKSMTFERFDPRPSLPPEARQSLSYAFRLAKEFAQKPQGWLVFLGTSGCGKTHLSAAIANYRRQMGEPVRFEVVPDFLDHLRSTFAPESPVSYDEVFEGVKQAPLLILDDFGLHATTPWAQEKLFQVINYRYNARLPTVITITAENDRELENQVGSQFFSRLADHSLSMLWTITAPDYRIDRGEAGRRQRRFGVGPG